MVSVALFFLPAETFAASEFKIGEIAWNGSSRSSADEWIELWNLGDNPIALIDMALYGASGEGSVMRFSEADVIAPRSVFLIANYPPDHKNSALSVEPNIVTSTLSFSNDSFTLKLVNSSGVEIDNASATDRSQSMTNTDERASMVRSSLATTTWIEATTSQNFDVEISDFGTPGICDECATAEAVEISETSTSTENIFYALPLATSTMDYSNQLELSSTTPSFYATSTENYSDEQTTSTLALTSSTDDMSTTEQVIDESQSTSTDAMVDTYTSSTMETTSSTIVLASTSSSNEIADTLSTQATSTEDVVAAAQTIYRPPQPFDAPSLKLCELYPAPTSEDDGEWIKLEASYSTLFTRFEGWTIENSTRVIFRWSETTVDQIQQDGTLFAVLLTSGHLRNGGDTIFLRNAQGVLIDQTSYPVMKQGEGWIKQNGADTWRSTLAVTPTTISTPTPTVTQKIQAIPVQKQPSALTVTSTRATSTVPVIAIPATSTIKSKTPTPKAIATVHSTAITKPVSKKAAATTTRATTIKKTAAKKTTTKSTSSSIIAPRSSTISSLASMDSDIRVRLRGSIGTIPGLLKKNQFVLLSPEGQGLLITGNGKQPSPPRGSQVEITGQLLINDDGTSLVMQRLDRWIAVSPSSTVKIRSVNMEETTREDSWSLMQIEGTVAEVKASTIRLRLDDETEILASIRPVIHYRASRFLTGDKISVKGILDLSKEEPTLIPASGDDIAIIQRVPVQTSSPIKSTQLPPWTPFGVAGASVAFVHGVKKYRRFREERKLKSLVQLAQKQFVDDAP